MRSWRDLHPDWEYTLYDNKFLKDYDFRTRRQIDEYLKRGQPAGAADLMRLEILYECGGLLPGADSICLRNTDELFPLPRAYTVYENEFARGKLVSPIQASAPHNDFILKLIETLAATDPETLDDPWISTGNLFTALMIEQYAPDIIIFPSHYLIPIHFTGVSYKGDGPIYARQMFGSTRNAYLPGRSIQKALRYIASVRQRFYRIRRLASVRRTKNRIFD